MLYALVMETQQWRPNVGIAELEATTFIHLGADAPSPSPWFWSSFVAVAQPSSGWRGPGHRRHLRRAARRTAPHVQVEFTPHTGDEMLRDGNWVSDWTPSERTTHERFERRVLITGASRCIGALYADRLALFAKRAAR